MNVPILSPTLNPSSPLFCHITSFKALFTPNYPNVRWSVSFWNSFFSIFNTIHPVVVLLRSLRTISFSLLYFFLIPLCPVFPQYSLLWRVSTYSTASTTLSAQIILGPSSSLAFVSSFCSITLCNDTVNLKLKTKSFDKSKLSHHSNANQPKWSYKFVIELEAIVFQP